MRAKAILTTRSGQVILVAQDLNEVERAMREAGYGDILVLTKALEAVEGPTPVLVPMFSVDSVEGL